MPGSAFNIASYRKGILFTAACIVMSAAAMSAGDPTPSIRGEVVQDTARIVISGDSSLKFTAASTDSALTIAFNQRIDPSFRDVLKALYPYVISAERKSDGKTVTFTLDKLYRVRTFAEGRARGVELLHVDLAARPDLVKHMVAAIAKLAPAAGEETPVTVVEPAPKAEPAPSAESKPVAETPAEAAVVAAPTPATDTVPESMITQERKSIPLMGVPAAIPEAEPAPELPTVVEAPAEIPSPTSAAAEQLGDNQNLSEEKAQEALPVVAGRVKIGVSAASDNAVLRFPFTERVAMTAFVRNRALWVAWHKPLVADLTDFDELPRTVIGKAEIVPAQGATVIRMPIDDGVSLGVTKEENSFDWAILITPKKRDLEKALPVQVNTDPPAPAHVFVPALETAGPVTVIDPQIGDQLILTPFYSVSEGIGLQRDFVEFSLLPTAQGLAVIKRSEDVSVLTLRNGLRISLPQGASLTPGLPEVEQSKMATMSQQSLTLFPYEDWKPDDAAKTAEYARILFHRIVESDNPQDANNARLRLAQLRLSQGLAVEALGYLDGVNRTNPAFFRSSKLAALRGSANFLMHRFGEAARDFRAAELNNNKEVDYWRSMLADLLGNPDQSYDYLALNEDYISKYPPVFRQRLAIVAADRAIAGKDYNTALKIFDTLTQDRLNDSINNYVSYLTAKISSETGQDKEAKDTWDKLATDYKHPFVQARAEFSRILWEIDHENLPKDKVIDRLERLRTAWHGDGLELNVLTMLGDLYADQKDYVNAMRIWHGGVLSFQNTTSALDMTRKMQEAFIVMFSEGMAEQLQPLEALSLYYEYRSYAPPGNTGNEIINRLADRLVSVDLLSQAAALLDHQMHFAAEKEKRSELGARLATVYLLNHQPAKALTALQDSVYGENPLTLRLWRNRLTAQAMIELGQTDRALLTLGTDNSEDAERIRVSVYWREKDWPLLITSIENLLKTRKDITAPVTLDESEYLIKLALAYVFQNNRVQLQYLYDYFTPLMASNPNKQVFDFITGGDIQLTTNNFDAVIKNVADTRSFIENYRANTHVAGLAAAAPKK